MKNRVVKVSLVLLSLIMATASMFACGRKKVPNSPSDIEISVLNTIGIDFVEELKTEFKKEFPDINIIIKPNISYGIFDTTIGSGPNTNSTDLYLTYAPHYRKSLKHLEPLNDALDDKLEGQTKSIKERLSTQYIKNSSIGDNIYTLPWQSNAHGIVYNHAEFAANGWSVPKTTNDLLALSNTIKTKGNVPFIHNMSNYWSYAYEGWWAQYEGVDEYFNFYNAEKIIEGESTYPNVEVFAQQGRYESIKVLQDILTYDDNNNFKYVFSGSNTTTHTEAQTKFLGGVAMMMPNAGWLESEMSKEWEAGMDFRMMKLPVISSITKKLSDVKDETTLKEVIKFVDNEIDTAPSGVRESDIARVRQVRNITYTTNEMHTIIPNYAVAKSAAKDFLKFMYSDKGLSILTKKMIALPSVNFDKAENMPDTTKWSTFAQSHLALQKSAEYVFNPYSCPVFYNNNVRSFKSYPELTIGASNVKDRKTYEAFVRQDYEYAMSKWADWTK